MNSSRYVRLMLRVSNAIAKHGKPARISIEEYHRFAAEIRLRWSLWVFAQLAAVNRPG